VSTTGVRHHCLLHHHLEEEIFRRRAAEDITAVVRAVLRTKRKVLGEYWFSGGSKKPIDITPSTKTALAGCKKQKPPQ
jgi:hypothetical protein